jgi:hypothetical protein
MDRVNISRTRLGNHPGGAPSLHCWIEVELEKVLEGYHVNAASSLDELP